jgi:hypothetical protein
VSLPTDYIQTPSCGYTNTFSISDSSGVADTSNEDFIEINDAGDSLVFHTDDVDFENTYTIYYTSMLNENETVLNPDEDSRTYSSVFENDANGTGYAQSMLDSA